MPKVKHRSKRRVKPLQDADYDHEISLTDAENLPLPQPNANTNANANANSGLQPPRGRSASDDGHATSAADAPDRRDSTALLSVPTTTTTTTATTTNGGPLLLTTSAAESSSPLLPVRSNVSAMSAANAPRGRKSMRFAGAAASEAATATTATPTVALQRATTMLVSDGDDGSVVTASQAARRVRPHTPESAVDVLFENQRGVFLCGIPLFSGLALGNLDPSPWTNQAQKTSITDIHTAQVPDPTWTWAWPEWRIYREEDDKKDKNGKSLGPCHRDEDGWEYSFMFARHFSWHGPTWYNSFVRRRVWIRKRVKRPPEDAAAVAAAAASSMGLSDGDDVLVNPQMLNPDYFVVMPAGSTRRSTSQASRVSSRVGGRVSSRAGSPVSPRTSSRASSLGESRRSLHLCDDDAASEKPPDMTNADELLAVLRGAAIDRQRLRVIDAFLVYGDADLEQLPDRMHDIMRLFVFQQSRRALVTTLTVQHRRAVRVQEDPISGLEASTEEALPQTEADAETEKQEAEPVALAQAPAPEDDAADETTAQHTPDRKGKGKARAEAFGEAEPAKPAKPAEPTEPATPAAPKEPTETTAPGPDPAALTRIQEDAARRAAHLAAALAHAQEEVRQFEYWSDVQAVARAQAGDAVEGEAAVSPMGAKRTATSPGTDEWTLPE